MCDIYDAMNADFTSAELDEARAEIERHHRDFNVISDIVHDALDKNIDQDWLQALRAIRNIVG